MVRSAAPASFLLCLSISLLLLLLQPRAAMAHSPEDSYSARADLRVDDQRGLRVRTWFEVPNSSAIARGDADAAVAALAECLALTLGGEPAAGSWRAGADPKHGLSNGSHRLYALEFEPSEAEAAPDARPLKVELVVECFPEHDLAFEASIRARDPWRVADEALPSMPAHDHDHDRDHHRDVDAAREGNRRALVRFVRD